MADNVPITAGTGTSIATEDEGGVHYQVVKLAASGSGTTATLSKAEDVAHTTADHGIPALAVRRDTAAVGSDTDGDYSTVNVDASGRLWTHVGASDVGATTDTEDGTVADGQASVSLVIGLPYSWDGDNWTRAGATTSRTISAASTNATNVKAAAGVVYAITASNINAAARYLKLYNKASAPTVGSDTPVMTLLLPAGGGFSENYAPTGLAFATGIGFALTTEATDAGSTGVSANEHIVHIHYK